MDILTFLDILLKPPQPFTGLFFKILKAHITHFLWDNKPPRIAYAKLIQDYNKLGLKLVDPEIKDKAIKIAWVHRWGNEKTKPWMVANLLVGMDKIWETNLSSAFFKNTLLENSLSTIQSIWHHWNEYTFIETPESVEEILQMPICWNSLVQKANKPFKPVDTQLQVEKIYELIDPATKKLMTPSKIKNTLGQEMNFLNYCSLSAAIPVLTLENRD